MTPQQLKALDFIKSYYRVHRLAPTLVEIMDSIGHKSKASASRIVRGLEVGGYIVREANKTRALTVTQKGWDYPSAPVDHAMTVQDG